MPTSLLAARNAWLFLVATFVTNIGNGIQTITAAYVTLKYTGSATSVGVLFLIVTGPQALVSILAGRFADRNSKKWICVLCDLARALCVLAMASAVKFSNEDGTVYIIYAATFCVSMLDAVFNPVSNAFLNDVASGGERAKVSARFESATQAGAILSVSAGGFLVAWVGADAAFLLNGLSFLASASLISRNRPN